MSTNYENENYETFENEGTEVDAGSDNGKGLLALVGGGALLLGGLTVASINKLKAKKAEKADKPKKQKTKKKLKWVPVEEEVDEEEIVEETEEDVEKEPEKGKKK